MQRDLELLAAIGSSDQRSLRAVGFSRQLADARSLPGARRAARRDAGADHHGRGGDARRIRPGDVPADRARRADAIQRRIDEALEVLKDPVRRAAYDKLHARAAPAKRQRRSSSGSRSARIAEQNFTKAKELTVAGRLLRRDRAAQTGRPVRPRARRSLASPRRLPGAQPALAPRGRGEFPDGALRSTRTTSKR